MTALKEFQRLEAQAVYRPGPGAQRRDVIICLGEATLTLVDPRASEIAHWSLAAVARVNPGKRPAIFAPGQDAAEAVEVSDETMIGAIERVLIAVDRARPHPGRLRSRLTVLATVGLLAAAVAWLPDAILRYTASVVPSPTRQEIGRTLMDEVTQLTGPPCTAPSGVRALDVFRERVLPDVAGAQLHVVQGGVVGAAHLPGGVVLIDRRVVEDHETPEVAAGFVLAEMADTERTDPLRALLDYAGLRAALTLMTTGRLPDSALKGYAQATLAIPSAALPEDLLLAHFAQAGVPTTPYAKAIDMTGEQTLALIEADPMADAPIAPILSDDAWIALQGICERS
ncbi:MAG: hypothetical protein AAGB18_05460 [Pseudomonadota bacterium]